MNEAREKAINQIFAEQRKLWETGDALYPHKDTLRLGYDAGYDSRDAEVEGLSDLLTKSLKMLSEVSADHKYPDCFEYNECDKSPCNFCEEVDALNLAKAALSSCTQEK